MKNCKILNFLWLFMTVSVLLLGCGKKEPAMGLMPIVREIDITLVDEEIQVINEYFFPQGCKKISITTDFTNLDDDNLRNITEANLLIEELRSYENGTLYELKMDVTGDSRFHLGYFYVTETIIYRFIDEKELSHIDSEEDILAISSIVCQSSEYKDTLSQEENGWHEYLEEIDINKMAYHRYSNHTETGFYECLIFEEGEGLIGYYCGYGAQKDAFEISTIHTVHAVKFANEPLAYVEETQYFDRCEYVFYDEEMNAWLYGRLLFLKNINDVEKFQLYLYQTDGTLIQTLEASDVVYRNMLPTFLDANMDGYLDIYFSGHGYYAYLFLWDDVNQRFVEPIVNVDVFGGLSFRGRILYNHYRDTYMEYEWDGLQLKELIEDSRIPDPIITEIPEITIENGKVILHDEGSAATMINAHFEEQYNKWTQEGFQVHTEVMDYNGYNLSVLHRVFMDENDVTKEYYYASNFDMITGEKLMFSRFSGIDFETIKDMLAVCLDDYETDFLAEYSINDNFFYDGKYIFFIFNEGTISQSQSILMLWDLNYMEYEAHFLTCKSRTDQSLMFCKLNETKANVEVAYDMYYKFLNGKISASTHMDNEEYYIDDWIQYSARKNYAFFDMNNDDLDELHIYTDDDYFIISAEDGKLRIWTHNLFHLSSDEIRMPVVYDGRVGIMDVKEYSDGTDSYYFYDFYDFGVMRDYNTLSWYDNSRGTEGMDAKDMFYKNGKNISMEEWLIEEELYKKALSQSFQWEELYNLPYKNNESSYN